MGGGGEGGSHFVPGFARSSFWWWWWWEYEYKEQPTHITETLRDFPLLLVGLLAVSHYASRKVLRPALRM
jgi:hypothetical protein